MGWVGGGGLQTALMMHEMILSADDIVFLLQDPVTSVTMLGALLDLFGRASRYKISVFKSVIMGFNMTPE